MATVEKHRAHDVSGKAPDQHMVRGMSRQLPEADIPAPTVSAPNATLGATVTLASKKSQTRAERI
jgi:hypothetical protein